MKTHLVFFFTLFVASLVGCSTRPPQALSDNKATILHSEAELWSKGNLAVADELYAPDFICHFAGGMEWRGVEGIKGAVASHRASFPALRNGDDSWGRSFAVADRVRRNAAPGTAWSANGRT